MGAGVVSTEMSYAALACAPACALIGVFPSIVAPCISAFDAPALACAMELALCC